MDEASSNPDLTLARQAAAGDRRAQSEVNELVHPVIDFQTDRFCKRFCRQNRYLYRCSLSRPVGSPPADAALCEWGNASYGWMLDDLCKAERLQRFEGRDRSRLFDYLYSIANSLPFYERWKDWRFGRRQQVPQYIRDIDERAAAVFYALRQQQPPAIIAQSLSLPIPKVEDLIDAIVVELTRRHRLYLLNPPQLSSLTAVGGAAAEEEAHQTDIAVYDEDIEVDEQRERLQQAWGQLDPVEQFVVEAMVIEEQDADTVLKALATLDVSIKSGVAAADTDRQQLYYFKRKALSKLGAGFDRTS